MRDSHETPKQVGTIEVTAFQARDPSEAMDVDAGNGGRRRKTFLDFSCRRGEGWGGGGAVIFPFRRVSGSGNPFCLCSRLRHYSQPNPASTVTRSNLLLSVPPCVSSLHLRMSPIRTSVCLLSVRPCVCLLSAPPCVSSPYHRVSPLCASVCLSFLHLLVSPLCISWTFPFSVSPFSIPCASREAGRGSGGGGGWERTEVALSLHGPGPGSSTTPLSDALERVVRLQVGPEEGKFPGGTILSW